ncbi:Insertion element IS630 uncharacterized 39 kDa protein [Labeo rohita]|uniref:Insertion element IS630 uncharacterized 39 kDa protein n=1 Tax=Labeo rohita TaxID=84645 RepID=A0ABQ8MWB1_LABRO|nr:Insertion element IS630 uncharacterized 39 kDa protein [Labeo rohita]
MAEGPEEEEFVCVVELQQQEDKIELKFQNEIRATIIDHVINHGLSFREAGQRVQPILSRSTVASIVRLFRNENRIHTLPHTGGRGKIFGIEQESAIVDMVVANNAIRLREIQAAVIADQGVFRNIKSVSLATIDRVLKLNHVRMKQLYRVPFQRNSDIVKEARFQYVQRIMEFEAEGAHHKFIFVDEAGFNLCKVRRRRRNITGQRATVTVPEILIPPEERGLLRPGMTLYVITGDNVAFHHSRLVNEWFAAQPRIMMQFLPAYSPFLNPIEEFFSAWRWKVYDHRPYEQMPLLEAMNAGCLAIGAEDCQGWIRHARSFASILESLALITLTETVWRRRGTRVNRIVLPAQMNRFMI